MSEFTLKYTLRFADGTAHEYPVQLGTKASATPVRAEPNTPQWTALAYHQCPNCPLDPAVHAHCPVACGLAPLVQDMHRFQSHDVVDVEVRSPQRLVTQHTSLQRALGSLLGLIFAASGCPHTRWFQPMAYFHLPLADEEETLYRAASMYLLAQYFRARQGLPADYELQNLAEIYRNIQVVNRGMAGRLRAASDSDAAVNAVVLLDLFAKAMPDSITGSLPDVAHLFAPYFESD